MQGLPTPKGQKIKKNFFFKFQYFLIGNNRETSYLMGNQFFWPKICIFVIIFKWKETLFKFPILLITWKLLEKWKFLVKKTGFPSNETFLCCFESKNIQIWKKNFSQFFDLMGVANLAFLGARVLGSRTKFKNRFGDGNSIIISYQPLPHMPL